MAELMEYLQLAVDRRASDIFVVAGVPITIKVDGKMERVDDERVMPPRTLELITELYAKAGRSMDRYLQTGDDDFSFAQPGMARFRVNTYRQRGSCAMVIRVVAFSIPDWKQLGIPEHVMELSKVTHGMVLVSGTAGSGKSTTLACIIDKINRERNCHIITLEDPIEYLHRDVKAIVSQREISIDTDDFVSALRACLRQAPDVIQVGEMRDLETIRAAMTAAETGHYLLATLHTKGAVNTIDRIIDIFPPEQQQQIRVQLAMVLDTVVSQQLIPDINGDLIPAVEIMHMTDAIANEITENNTKAIKDDISQGADKGMISMDQSIRQLLTAGRITRETAVGFAFDQDAMRRWISRL
jgi:twitching motility protein PilT